MTNRAVASRYARALFEVSCNSGDPEQTDRDLAAFQAILDGHTGLNVSLLNPAISPVRKRGVVDAILAKTKTSVVVKRLLLMLAERDRLNLLPDLREVYGDLLMVYLGVLRARITTAEPLPAARLESLIETLVTATGRKVTVETSVDDALVGGMVTQIGSTVFDGSLAHHLRRLRQRFLTST